MMLKKKCCRDGTLMDTYQYIQMVLNQRGIILDSGYLSFYTMLSTFPKDFFPSGNFTGVFSQMCNFPSGNFINLSWPQRSAPSLF